MMGNQTREKLENFRGYGGAQSYPSRTKDVDDVDFSTGSVGLGVAITAFASLMQDYLEAKPWASNRQLGRMIALVGDAELDDGAGAHHAGAERGIEGHAAVAALAAGLAQAVHLAMGDGVALLDALVAAARDQLVAARERAADGASAFFVARERLVIGDAQKFTICFGEHFTPRLSGKG